MKSFVSLLTAIVLTLALSISAFAADNPMDGIQSFGYQGSVKMTVSDENDTVDLQVPFVVRQVINRDDTVDMEIEMTVEGEKVIMYFKNDTMYIPVDAQTKLKMESAPTAEAMALVSDEAFIQSLADELMETADIETLEDGSVRTRIATKTDALADMVNEVYAAMGLDAEMDDLTLYLSMITDKNDDLKSMTMVMRTSLEAEGETADVEISVAMQVISQGQYRQIYFPSDLNLYTRA